MARPRLPWSVIRVGLIAYARGATPAEAAAVAGCSERTLWRRLAEEPVVVLRERTPRGGALSLKERVDIQVGIELGESDSEIGGRIGRHRSTVWREIAASGGRQRYRAFK